MTDPPPHRTPGLDPRDKQFSSLLDKGRAEGEPISFPPPCISANPPPRSQLELAGHKQGQVESSGWKRPAPGVLQLLEHFPPQFQLVPTVRRYIITWNLAASPPGVFQPSAVRKL